MAIATGLFTPASSPSFSPLPKITPKFATTSPLRLHLRLSSSSSTTSLRHRQPSPFLTFSTLPGGDGGDSNINNNNSGGGGGNNDNGKGHGGDENAGDKNRKEAMIVLAEAGRSMESLPKDLAAAIQAGRIPGSVIERFLGLEKSGLMRWLMQFGGFKERLLADDLFLAKVAMECGVGIFTKTAAEYERRRENFFKELEIVFADVVMAIIADFMLVYLPAPTVSLRPPLAVSAGAISKFFYSCPDNAFQVALPGTSYSLLQRLGAVMRNGAKLFAVGTTSSLVGTAVTNALINARKAVDKSSAAEIENVPILSTSVAYGVYMAVSSNLSVLGVTTITSDSIRLPTNILSSMTLWLNHSKVPSAGWCNRAADFGAIATPEQAYVECNMLCCSNRQHILGFPVVGGLRSFGRYSEGSGGKHCIGVTNPRLELTQHPSMEGAFAGLNSSRDGKAGFQVGCIDTKFMPMVPSRLH